MIKTRKNKFEIYCQYITLIIMVSILGLIFLPLLQLSNNNSKLYITGWDILFSINITETEVFNLPTSIGKIYVSFNILLLFTLLLTIIIGLICISNDKRRIFKTINFILLLLMLLFLILIPFTTTIINIFPVTNETNTIAPTWEYGYGLIILIILVSIAAFLNGYLLYKVNKNK